MTTTDRETSPTPPPASGRRVLLIGASRGLGLALAQEWLRCGWQVVATVRGPERTRLHDLADAHAESVEIETVDVTVPEQIAALRRRLASRTFDLLFVNAGVTNEPEGTVAETSTEEFVRVMVTNALGPLRVVEALQDLVTPTGTIGVMSSGQGSVADNERGGHEVYRGSKAALNTFMRSAGPRLGAHRARWPRCPADHRGEHPERRQNPRLAPGQARAPLCRLPRPDRRMVSSPGARDTAVGQGPERCRTRSR